jgi:hypothetical protein
MSHVLSRLDGSKGCIRTISSLRSFIVLRVDRLRYKVSLISRETIYMGLRTRSWVKAFLRFPPFLERSGAHSPRNHNTIVGSFSASPGAIHLYSNLAICTGGLRHLGRTQVVCCRQPSKWLRSYLEGSRMTCRRCTDLEHVVTQEAWQTCLDVIHCMNNLRDITRSIMKNISLFQ